MFSLKAPSEASLTALLCFPRLAPMAFRNTEEPDALHDGSDRGYLALQDDHPVAGMAFSSADSWFNGLLTDNKMLFYLFKAKKNLRFILNKGHLPSQNKYLSTLSLYQIILWPLDTSQNHLGKGNPIWVNAPIRLAFGAFSLLTIDVGEPWSLWVVSSLNWWSWVLYESKIRDPWGPSQ